MHRKTEADPQLAADAHAYRLRQAEHPIEGATVRDPKTGEEIPVWDVIPIDRRSTGAKRCGVHTKRLGKMTKGRAPKGPAPFG